MADLTRPDFGEAWASEGEKLSPDSAKIKLGWVREMMPYQFENFLQSRQDEAILYLLQKGVPEYSPTQEYTANKSVVVYQGNLYMATATVIGVLPTVAASWKRISPTVGTNGAVAISSGGTGATSVAEARTNLGLGTASTANLPSTNGVVVRSGDNTLISRLLTGTSGNISITNPDGAAGNININVGTNVAQLDKDSSWTSKGGITLPKGSSSNRGVEVAGKIRYNTELQKFEGYNGTSWNALGAASEVEITTLSGDGVTAVFTLNTPAFSESSTDVYIGGVYQNKGTYSVSGTTLTFSEAPTPGTDNIQVVSRRVTDLGIARASQVSIEDTSNYYTSPTVEGALREVGDKAKFVKNAILSYPDYASASAAAAMLPDGQEIEAPNADGRLSRFEVQGNALVFKDYAPDAIRMQSYTALRAYTGNAQAIDITTPGVAGRFYLDASDTITADNGGTVIVGADGRRWKRSYGWEVDARWFGAKADYNPATGTGTDNTPAFMAALATYQPVTAPFGLYMISGDGIVIEPGQTLDGKADGYIGSQVDSALWGPGPGVVLIPRNVNASYSVDAMITECELSGGVLANPSAGAAYTASSGTRLNTYRLHDFTNQNAVGATAATPRQISVAVRVKRGARLSGVFIRTTSNSGALTLNAEESNHGHAPDIGILAENAAFSQIRNCHASWAFRMYAFASLQVEASDGYYPQGDRLITDRCFFEGHVSYGIRNYDSVVTTAISGNTVRCKWFRSHRFTPTGQVRIGSTLYTYTSLAHDPGTNELVFTLTASPSETAGALMCRGQDARSYGQGGTIVSNSFLRSISHPSSRPSTDSWFAAPFPYCGKLIEISGTQVRGIHFIGSNYLHSREDIALWVNNGSDVYLSGYHEPKWLNTGGDHGAACARFIALSLAAKTAIGVPQPVGGADSIYFRDWSQTETGTDRSPVLRNRPTYGRFGTADGYYNPECGDALDYDTSITTSGYGKDFRAPNTGTRHPFTFRDRNNNVRASMDRNGRWQFGDSGLEAITADLEAGVPGTFQSAGTTTVRAKNTASATRTQFQAVNTAGNAALAVGSAGEGELRSGNVTRLTFVFNRFAPASDGSMDFGGASNRIKQIFATDSAIQTSDANEKTAPEPIPDALLDAWGEVHSTAWKWLHSVAQKGDLARTHTGPIAQHLRDALVRHGIMQEGSTDCPWAGLGYDEWPAEYQPVFATRLIEKIVETEPGVFTPVEMSEEYETGEMRLVKAAGSRWSIRPTECLFVAVEYLNRRCDRIEQRLTALEADG